MSNTKSTLTSLSFLHFLYDHTLLHNHLRVQANMPPSEYDRSTMGNLHGHYAT